MVHVLPNLILFVAVTLNNQDILVRTRTAVVVNLTSPCLPLILLNQKVRWIKCSGIRPVVRIRVRQKHLENRFKHRLPAPSPQSFWFSGGGPWKFALLVSSQILLVQASHFEKHWIILYDCKNSNTTQLKYCFPQNVIHGAPCTSNEQMLLSKTEGGLNYV